MLHQKHFDVDDFLLIMEFDFALVFSDPIKRFCIFRYLSFFESNILDDFLTLYIYQMIRFFIFLDLIFISQSILHFRLPTFIVANNLVHQIIDLVKLHFSLLIVCKLSLQFCFLHHLDQLLLLVCQEFDDGVVARFSGGFLFWYVFHFNRKLY